MISANANRLGIDDVENVAVARILAQELQSKATRRAGRQWMHGE